MSPETVSKTWRQVLAGGANAGDDEIIRRLETLEAWARSRIAECDKALELYTTFQLLPELSEHGRLCASSERTALVAVLRILNDVPEIVITRGEPVCFAGPDSDWRKP